MLKQTLMPILRQRFARFSACGAVHETCQGVVSTVPTLQFALVTTTLCNANDKLELDSVAWEPEYVLPDLNEQSHQLKIGKLTVENISRGKNKQKYSRLPNGAVVENNRSYIKDFVDVRCFGTERFIDNLKNVIVENCLIEVMGDVHCMQRTEAYHDKNFACVIITLDQNKLRCGEHILRILRSGNSVRTLSERHLLSELIYSN